MTKEPDGMRTCALILAGGRGTRLDGQDKGWVAYRGTPLIEQVIQRLQPQVDELVISCNRNIQRYRNLGYPVTADEHADFGGPLAGIAAASRLCTADYILLSPCDAPRLPTNLVQRLLQALQDSGADAAIPVDGFGRQYLSSLLRRKVIDSAQASLDNGVFAVKRWLATLTCVDVNFGQAEDGFYNINRLEELVDQS
jgi:molybdenum cofactor guanylyltransferase